MEEELTTNTSVRMTLEEEEWSEYLSSGIPFTVYLISLFLFGTIGNSITLYVYYKKPPSNCRMFVLWLAMLDLLSCAGGIPEYVYRERYNYTYTNNVLCKAFVFIHFFLSCYSVLILNLIAVERYMKTCKMFDRQMSGKQAKWACFCLGVVSVPFAVYPSNWIYGIANVQGPFSGLIGQRCAIPGIAKGQIFFGIFGFFNVFCLLFCAVFYALIHRMLIHHKNENKRLLQLTQVSTNSETKLHNICEDSIQKKSNNGKVEKDIHLFELPDKNGTGLDLECEDKTNPDFQKSFTPKYIKDDSPQNVFDSSDESDPGRIVDEFEKFNSHVVKQEHNYNSSKRLSTSSTSLSIHTNTSLSEHAHSKAIGNLESKQRAINCDAISNKIAQQSKQLSDHRSNSNIRSVSKYSLVSTSEAMIHQVTHTIDKSVKMTLIFCVASALSYISAIPYTTFMCIASIRLDTYYEVMEKLGTVGHFFLYVHLLNNVINPIVYCCMDTDFRRELKRGFCCQSKNKK